jgi:hypothetical protein
MHSIAAVVPLGVWLGLIAYRCDSSWPAVIGHVADDAFALIMMRFFRTETMEKEQSVPLLALAGMLSSSFLSLVVRYSLHRQEGSGRVLERYLLAWLLAICGVAFWWPEISGATVDAFVASKRAIPWLLAATMFAVGRYDAAGRSAASRETSAARAVGAAGRSILGDAAARLGGGAVKTDFESGIPRSGSSWSPAVLPGAMASDVITALNARGRAGCGAGPDHRVDPALADRGAVHALRHARPGQFPIDRVQVAIDLLLCRSCCRF